MVPLWSISVEEQFYLIWPPILKAGGRQLALFAAIAFIIFAAIWLWLFSEKSWQLWFDTPIGFLFFGEGAILAIWLHGKPAGAGPNMPIRGVLAIAGFFSLAVAVRSGHLGIDGASISLERLYLGYAAAAAGCALLFVAVLGLAVVPRFLTYLGKISYGLYVFHLGMLTTSTWIVRHLAPRDGGLMRLVEVDLLALLLSIGAAALSYKYFEMPFLKIKERFAVVHSRPA